MENLAQAMDMGGYGMYVWPSYIVAAITIIIMAIVAVRALRKAQKTLASLKDDKE